MVTDWFKSNYASTGFWTSNRKVGVKLYARSPRVTSLSNNTFKTYTALAGLSNHPEWVPVSATITMYPSDIYLKRVVDGDTDYLQLVLSNGTDASVDNVVPAGWRFDPTSPNVYSQDAVYVAVFYFIGTIGSVVNPIIWATSQGIGDRTIVHNGSVYGQASTNAGSHPHVVRVSNTTAITVDTNNFEAGLLYLKPSPPVWENAHALHIWVEPQRINYIANPSFEGGTFGWRSNSTMAVVTGGLNTSTSRTKCLHLQQSVQGDVIVLESNLFPFDSQWMSVSFNISGTGNVRFGLVNFDSSYYDKAYLRSEYVHISGGSATGGFTKFTGLIPRTDFTVESLLRIEISNPTDGTGSWVANDVWIDDVLVDPHESQYEYFDGDSNDGLVNDFRWVKNLANQHFSVWYNNYDNTRNRLMGGPDQTDTFTDANGEHPKYKEGLVDEWMPTGANIVVHWDAVSSYTPNNWLGDAYYPISNVNGTTVTSAGSLKHLSFTLVPY
jgi:hypothetical protein